MRTARSRWALRRSPPDRRADLAGSDNRRDAASGIATAGRVPPSELVNDLSRESVEGLDWVFAHEVGTRWIVSTHEFDCLEVGNLSWLSFPGPRSNGLFSRLLGRGESKPPVAESDERRRIGARRTSTPQDRGSGDGETPPSRKLPRNFSRNNQVLKLAAIREKIGDRWDEYGPSVHKIAARIIAQEMDGRGTFMQFDDAYVLKFDNLSRREGRRECRTIAEKLMHLIFFGKSLEEWSHLGLSGEKERPSDGTRSKRWHWPGFRSLIGRILRPLRFKDPKGEHIPAFVDSEPTADHGSSERATGAAGGPLSSERWTSDRSHRDGTIRQDDAESKAPGGLAGAAPHPSQASSAPVPANAASAGRGVNATRDASASDPVATPSRRSPAAQPGLRKRAEPKVAALEERRHGTFGLSPADRARLSREARLIENAMVAATVHQQHYAVENWSAAVFPPPDLDFVYRPMWNLSSNLLTTYCCVPVCNRTESLVTGDAVLPRRNRQQNALTLDVLTLEHVIADANALMERDTRPILMAPVHLSTLVKQSRRIEFLDSMASIQEGVHHRLLFEIIGIEEAVGQTRAGEEMGYLLPYCRGVLGRVPFQDRNFAFWKQIGLVSVGSDLSEDERPEPAIIDDLQAFASMANHNKVASYIRGLKSVSLASAAVAAGFAYIESSAIKAGDADRALDIVPFDLSDLYTSLQS